MSLRLLSVCAIAVGLVGCDEMGWGSSDRFTEEFSYEYNLKPGGRFAIENLNGSVEISGWDKNSVEIRGTKYASSQEAMKATRIDVQNGEDYVRVRTVPPSGRWNNIGARYVIHVPRRVELERIASSNGHLDIRDIEGPARLRTSNAHVRATDTRGAFEVETSNGQIELLAHTGAVSGHTSNARISADIRDPEQGRPIRLESSNGGITLKINPLNGNTIRLSTSNASIKLAVPENIGAQLRASTSNAHVRTSLPLNGTVQKSHAEGKLGAGGPYIDLTTSNGGIDIDRI